VILAQEIGLPATFLLTSFYYQNWQSFPPSKNDKGEFVFALGMPGETKLISYDVRDTGPVVAKILADGAAFIGKTVPVFGDLAPVQDHVKIFTEVTGLPAVYNAIPTEVYASFPFPYAGELAHMYAYFRDVGLQAGLDSVEPIVKLRSFKDWLQESGWKGEGAGGGH
jgi:uncharacterized protein YbjT (DUF2867 family)